MSSTAIAPEPGQNDGTMVACSNLSFRSKLDAGASADLQVSACVANSTLKLSFNYLIITGHHYPGPSLKCSAPCMNVITW